MQTKIYDWEKDCNLGDCDELETNFVRILFGLENGSEMDNATKIASKADIFIVIGTSMQVYPAAGLIHYVPKNCEIFVVDPHLENQFTKHENFFKNICYRRNEDFENEIIKTKRRKINLFYPFSF